MSIIDIYSANKSFCPLFFNCDTNNELKSDGIGEMVKTQGFVEIHDPKYFY